MRAGISLMAMVALSATTAAAQESSDGWDVSRDAASDRTIASVSYDGGLSLGVRCLQGTLDVIVIGLPTGTTADPELTMSLGAAPEETSAWLRGPQGELLSFSAPRHGRLLAQAGTVTFSGARAEGGVWRQTVDLPQDGSGVDQALQACGLRLRDERDLRPSVDELLTEDYFVVAPEFPEITTGQRSFEVSCIVAEAGRLTNCVTEQIRPRDDTAAPALAAALEAAELSLGDRAAEAVGRVLVVNVGQSAAEAGT